MEVRPPPNGGLEFALSSHGLLEQAVFWSSRFIRRVPVLPSRHALESEALPPLLSPSWAVQFRSLTALLFEHQCFDQLEKFRGRDGHRGCVY